MGNLSFQYSTWFIILAILVGAGYTIFLYYKSRKLNESAAKIRPYLYCLRFLAVALACFLLIGPYLKSIDEQSKDPRIALILDNSESIGEWLKDDEGMDVRGNLNQLKSNLEVKYEVDTYLFGKEIQSSSIDSLNHKEQITNLNQSLQYISDIYEGENLGAVVLATDGIFNEGRNPSYANYRLAAPVYSIALGDTSRRKDLIMKRIYHNEIAYLNDRISVQADVQSFNSRGEFTRLTVEKEVNNQYVTIHTRDINIQSDDDFETFDFPLEMDEVGVMHFRFRLNRLNDESNSSNNVKEIFIDVLDARQHILVMANAPHPDITAIKQLLESNKNYEVELSFEEPSVNSLNDADLVIFHNLPSRNRFLNRSLRVLDQEKTPRIFILGEQTFLRSFNQVNPSIQINSQANVTNEAQAIIESNFNYFNISEDLSNVLSRYPPLKAPFGEYVMDGDVATLLFQRIGSVQTEYPLLSFLDRDGIKASYLFGEGIWKWKLFNYLEDENFNFIDELLTKSIVYTSTKEDKRRFRVSAYENIFLENENVQFIAELYNNSYQLINEADVFHTIKNAAGEEFEFTFSKSDNIYTLNTGSFAPGTYSFSSSALLNGETFTANGRFSVSSIQYELFNQEARHDVLYDLAGQYGGDVVQLNEVDDLSNQLINSTQLKPILYQNIISKPLIDLKWIFLFMVGALGLEWFLRRYFGSL